MRTRIPLGAAICPLAYPRTMPRTTTSWGFVKGTAGAEGAASSGLDPGRCLADVCRLAHLHRSPRWRRSDHECVQAQREQGQRGAPGHLRDQGGCPRSAEPRWAFGCTAETQQRSALADAAVSEDRTATREATAGGVRAEVRACVCVGVCACACACARVSSKGGRDGLPWTRHSAPRCAPQACSPADRTNARCARHSARATCLQRPWAVRTTAATLLETNENDCAAPAAVLAGLAGASLSFATSSCWTVAACGGASSSAHGAAPCRPPRARGEATQRQACRLRLCCARWAVLCSRPAVPLSPKLSVCT